ncbi:MAG: [glutamine synthetase] adenylyltransferase / [glutamine synthetase]-adenylyl-L-tyrosine, partial [Acidimicrobiaceae bacterium]|nr:[glutamine synthetase] adenylyltransferase / [glutamine synthetase]-adenylyl-L-tyrosine [Acidimicrobiaceae bacterium]
MESTLEEAVERSADPASVGRAIAGIADLHPDARVRLAADPRLRQAVVSVTGASRFLTRLLLADDQALTVLSALDERPPVDRDDGAALARWKRLELLRVAGRDLTGLDPLEAVGTNLARLGEDVLDGAWRLAGAPPMAVIGMGKLGASELNYASDIDVMFVGEGDARRLLEVGRSCFRVDADLRPEGRSGPLVRSLASYEAYWDRWAEPWEFQALLKARWVAGEADLGAAFEAAASERVWNRPFGAEELRSVRAMKARAEGEVAKRGLTEREVKRGRGGIRDIEFAVQLLQLVHGRNDESVRSPTTLDALHELAAGGYVDRSDAERLDRAYR